MRSSLAAPLVASSLLLLASPAAAGPVSQTARGIENKVETHSDRPSRSDSPSSSDHGDSSHDDHQPSGIDHYYVHDDRSVCDGDCGTVRIYGAPGADEPRGELLPGPLRLDLYLGAHAVVDSQGAFVGDVRLSKGWLGASLSRTSYFEDVEGDGKHADQSVRLDIFSLAANVRLFSDGAVAMWLDAGLGATSSSEYDTVLGGMIGARLEHRLRPKLSVAALGRFYELQYDVSAKEGWAGVQAWFLRAGYRALQFNVGPALHGPEAGVAFQF